MARVLLVPHFLRGERNIGVLRTSRLQTVEVLLSNFTNQVLNFFDISR